MLDCKVCGNTCYTTYICSECNIIKDACNLYGRDVVINCIKAVLIRDEKQIKFKIYRANEEADGQTDNSHYQKDNNGKWVDKRQSEGLKNKDNK